MTCMKYCLDAYIFFLHQFALLKNYAVKYKFRVSYMLDNGLKTELRYELVHEISNNVVCATSKASDQPAHMRSLIRAFASRLSIL